MSLRLYIAGPMRGRPHYNFTAFDAARDRLVEMGHEVISPADLDRAHGFDAMALDPSDPCDGVPEGFCLRSCITRDVDSILDSDGVCFIDPGWMSSTGSIAEYHVAKWAGKRVFELIDGAGLVEVPS